MSNSQKVVITCAVTGGGGDKSTPNLPITPKEIADSAIGAARAGAAVVHIHVRHPETGSPSMEFAHYREVFNRVRDNCDVIINLTTGAGGRFFPDGKDPVGLGEGSNISLPAKRVEHVLKLKPEICSLDVGSMTFGAMVFVNHKPYVEEMAAMIKDAGVKPELEVFDLGHCWIAADLLAKGLLPPAPLYQICLGIPWGAPATSQNMISLRAALPADAIWASFGIAAHQFPMAAQAVILGGHVRVGMEDNLYLAKGLRAQSNAQLVEKAAAVVGILGKEVATAAEAREILGVG